MRWLDDITDSMDNEFEQAVGGDAGQGKPGVLESLGSQRVKHDWATELNLYVEHFFLNSQTHSNTE